MTFFKYFLYPSIKGILLADIIVLLGTLICYGIKAGNSFKNLPASWSLIGQSKAMTETEQKTLSYERTSIYFFFAGFSFLILSMRRIVPMPASETDNAPKTTKSSVISNKKKSTHHHNHQSMFLLDDDNDNNKLDYSIDMEIEMSTIIEWKRNCLLVKYFLSLTYFIVKFQVLSVPFYKRRFIICNTTLNIIETFTDELYFKYVFNEALHAAPILCLSKVSRFVMFLGSPDIGKTVFTYLVNLIEDTLFRLFAMPFFGRIEYLISRKIEYLALRRKTKHKGIWLFIYNTFFKPSNVDKKEPIDYDLIYYYEKPKQLQYLIEPILRCLFIYSTDVTSSIMKVHLMLLFFIFREEARTQHVFQMETTNIIKQYMIVSLGITLIEVPIAFGIVYLIESFYNLNIMEYVRYCSYRYSIRNSSWLNPMNIMDISVHSFWRSLDSLLFSEQYYYSLFNAVSGLVFIMFAFIVALNHSYNPFDDPFLIIFIGIYICILTAEMILGKVFDYFGGIFTFRPFNLNNKDTKMPDLIKLDSSNKDLANYMTNKLFRKKFIKINKKWIIDNLDFILGFDKLGKEFEELTANANEKLKQIYNEALNYEEIDNEIRNKKDDIKHNLKYMPYNRKDDYEGEFNQEFGMRLDISKDSIIDEPPLHCEGKIDKNVINKPYIKHLCKLWKTKAQERIKYKTWCVDVIHKSKLHSCQKCNADFNLHLRQETSIDVLIKEFKIYIHEEGKNDDKKTWETFYQLKQRFITLCMECAYLYDLDIDPRKNDVSEDINEEKEVEEKRKAIINKRIKKGKNKKILIAWLIEARKNILMRRIRRRNFCINENEELNDNIINNNKSEGVNNKQNEERNSDEYDYNNSSFSLDSEDS